MGLFDKLKQLFWPRPEARKKPKRIKTKKYRKPLVNPKEEERDILSHNRKQHRRAILEKNKNG
jgi:hypothetical protein